MRGAWWKILTVVLLLYTFAAGLLIPLRPGIVSNKTDLALEVGTSSSIYVNSYNTRYSQENPAEIQARIRTSKEQAVCAEKIEIKGDRQLQLFFKVPAMATESIKPPFPLLEIGSAKNGYVFTAIPLKKATSSDSTIVADGAFCSVEHYPENKGISFPFLNILEETIRNIYFHVPMWFGMMALMLISVIFSVRVLRAPERPELDIAATSFATVGTLYGFLGVTTGAMWATYTWGTPWSWDVKQNTSAVVLLIYSAYFVLRGSLDDEDKKARIGAIYNIFAFSTMIPLLYVIPRLTDSMHPGAQGNPGFNSYDLDSNMRLVFYPAIISWILLGVWISSLLRRIKILEEEEITS